MRQALPNLQVLFADSPSDIVIYREQPDLPINDLELLGKLGKGAYEQMTSGDGTSPHSREDITRWSKDE